MARYTFRGRDTGANPLVKYVKWSGELPTSPYPTTPPFGGPITDAVITADHGASGAIIDTFANRPAAGVPGRRFTPSDGYGEFVDNGTVWLPIFQGATGTPPPLVAALTAVNAPSGLSFTDDKGTLLVTQPPTAGANLGLIRLAAYPTPPFNLRIGFSFNTIPANTTGWGIFLRDSTTGRIMTVYKLFDSSTTRWFIQRFSTPTNFISSDINGDTFPNYTTFERGFFHLTDPGGSGNLIVSASQDGDVNNAAICENTVSRTAYVATPDQFGICMYTNTGVPAPRGNVKLRIFDWTYQ